MIVPKAPENMGDYIDLVSAEKWSNLKVKSRFLLS